MSRDWATPVYAHHLYRDPEIDPAPQPETRRPPPFRRQLPNLFPTWKWWILLFMFVFRLFLVVWFVLDPTFPLLTVASASISSPEFTATAATADLNVTLAVTNPNRFLTATYEKMEISLLYATQQGIVQLSQIHQPRIVQLQRSQISIKANLGFSGVDLGKEVIAAMKQELDRGSLGLTLKISSVIEYRNGKWKTSSRFMIAHCGGLSFRFTARNTSGIFFDPSQECQAQVYLYSKLK